MTQEKSCVARPPPAGSAVVREVLIATGNPGKFREIVAVMTDAGDSAFAPPVRWLSLSDVADDIPEPPETGETFEENAAIKALYYARRTGLWALADDSGLEVDALGGDPGVCSARYADSPPGTPRADADRANNAKLIRALAGVPAARRTARFRCVMVLADGRDVIARTFGVIEGRIIDGPRGHGGFGYDPHFELTESGMTTAELSAEQKNRISHRGQAARQMRARLAGICATPGTIPGQPPPVEACGRRLDIPPRPKL